MPFEKFANVETINTERRKAIAKSIRTISVEELKKLGEEIFDEPDRPWRQTFLSVVTENPGATFYHASAGEGVIFLYSRDNDKGLWYLPGSGIGPLSEGGRQLMKKGFGKHYTSGPGARWSEADRRNVEAFQRAQGWRGASANGYPDPETWRRLFA